MNDINVCNVPIIVLIYILPLAKKPMCAVIMKIPRKRVPKSIAIFKWAA